MNVLLFVDGSDGKMHSIILAEFSINVNSKWSAPSPRPPEAGTLSKKHFLGGILPGSERGHGPPTLQAGMAGFHFRQQHSRGKRSTLSPVPVCLLARLPVWHLCSLPLPHSLTRPSKPNELSF